jgi:hypothetical protein
MEAPISFKWWPPPSFASLPLVLLITIRAGQILEHSPTSVDRDPSRHLSPSEPRPSLWQSRSRPTKSTAPLHTRYLCSHPILFLSSSRPLVLSRWHNPTLGINLMMRWLLLQGTSINAIERLQDRSIHQINSKPSLRSIMQNGLYPKRMQTLQKATFIISRRSCRGTGVHWRYNHIIANL